MKYMTFNSSCSFAGVANMLQQLGVDVEDRQIAMGMNLPYLFDMQDGVYSAGPMLQSSKWFNLYLKTLGYALVENAVCKSELADYLVQCSMAMLGLRITPEEKHAVIFVGMDEDQFRLINNKWEHSDTPEMICLSKMELEQRVDDTVMVATISEVPASSVDFSHLLCHSCQVLEQYKVDVQAFCRCKKSKEEITAAMNKLFRATLLDGITMLELIDQDELADQFRLIQQSYLSIIREGKTVVMSEHINMSAWMDAVDKYIALIRSTLLKL